jgi:hypothetical protein
VGSGDGNGFELTRNVPDCLGITLDVQFPPLGFFEFGILLFNRCGVYHSRGFGRDIIRAVSADDDANAQARKVACNFRGN